LRVPDVVVVRYTVMYAIVLVPLCVLKNYHYYYFGCYESGVCSTPGERANLVFLKFCGLQRLTSSPKFPRIPKSRKYHSSKTLLSQKSFWREIWGENLGDKFREKI